MNISIRRFAAAVLAATGLAVGIGASSASATPFISTSLSLVPVSNNDYIVRVFGHIEMSQADAQAACDHPGDPLDVQLYGWDAGVLADDVLISKAEFAVAPMNCATTASGIDWVVSLIRDGDVLNEDAGQDEIYAYITFLDIRTGTTHLNSSGISYGRF